MSSDRDLYGKMNALFEKRAPDALLDKGLDHEDFPILTDVVAGEPEPTPPPPPPPPPPSPKMKSRRDEAMPAPRPAPPAAKTATPPATPPAKPAKRPAAASAPAEQDIDEAQLDRVAALLEQRLAKTFIRQQAILVEAVRRTIREELEKARKPL